MFLMNLVPVSAVQTDWQSFGASSSYSLPVGFSIPRENFSAVGSTLDVNVQMIVENLQPRDSSHAMNNDPNSNAKTNLDTKWRSEGALDNRVIKVLKGAAVEDLKTGYPTCTLGTEESNLGQCVLDTDSDESVDRSIEEAIQEYLKKKTEENCSISSTLNDAEVPPGIYPAVKDSARNANNGISLEGEVVPTEFELDLVNIDPLHGSPEVTADSRCSSPSSINSNDSFELSIQAEIERFLQDKRKKESSNPSHKLASESEPTQKENLLQADLKSKKRYVKPSTGSQMQIVKALMTNPNTQVTGTKSTDVDEAGSICKTGKSNERNPKGHKKMASEKKPTAIPISKELYRSSNIQWNMNTGFSDPKPNSITTETELSDSSSDDGIEEAIQLYQLEQKKTKDVPFALGLLPHNPPCSLDACDPAKGEEKETLQVSLRKKWKQGAPKSVDAKSLHSLNPFDTVSTDQMAANFLKQEERKWTNSLDLKRMETSSEFFHKQEVSLVLGIHPHTDSITSTTLLQRATADSQQITSSDSDESSVDSSDSIEKEIQNYLALKVNQGNQKLNGMETVSESDRLVPPELKEEDGLNNSPSLFSALPSIQVPLLQKERLKNNVSTDHKLGTANLRESQQKGSGFPISRTNSNAATSKSKLKGGLLERDSFDASNVQDSKAVNRKQDKLSPVNWAANEQTWHKPVHDAWQTDDKSSSLDSDEDLDTATKDLLKTRKRMGKRLRDSKSRCRKRVRFTGAEVLTFTDQSTGFGDQTHKVSGEGFVVSHAPLKSCLSKTSKAVCRSYLDFKSKSSKRAGETSEGEGRGKVARMGRPVMVSLSVTPSTVAEGLNQKTITSESSSGDSDDGIEQEILRFLAEKARGNSTTEESLKGHIAMQNFTEHGKENRSSEVSDHGGGMPSVSQPVEGTCSIGTKGPHHEEEEVAAWYSFGGTENTAAESKPTLHGPDLLQDLHTAHSAEHQTEHRQVVGELSAVFQTEAKTGIDQGNLQVTTAGCRSKENCIRHFALHSNVLQDREVNDPLGSCITQNLQERETVHHFKTIQPKVQQQNIQYIANGQLQPKAAEVRSSEESVAISDKRNDDSSQRESLQPTVSHT
ncbi:protein phosphatase 1 regulatory subunit 26 isoform X2 [Narcine bancroftii]|uniref:protein phosphatase 1 regulatory subunit 26 isoform X2 n=1 Tax=Narcine bancroftii TaxID=1343680 RepID=UPI00383147C6